MPPRDSAPWSAAALAEALAARGALLGARVAADGEEGPVLEGRLWVEGRALTLRVELGPHFPVVVPTLRLLEPSRHGLIAHVNRCGTICLARQDGMLLDADQPLDALVALIARARRVLQDGLTGASRAEIQEEWEAYWRAQPRAITVAGHVSPRGAARTLVVQKKGKNQHTPVMVADDLVAYTAYYLNQPWCGDLASVGLFVPLPLGVSVSPPLPGEVWRAQDYRDRLLSVLDGPTQAAVARHTARWRRDHVIVFSLPRRQGGHALFGAWFHRVHTAHPLAPKGEAEAVVPLVLKRRDPDFLRPRGGADAQLHRRKVAVVGCGSVGGYIAAELARAGVGHLTLVDGDVLNEENTFRHHLSRSCVGHNKAEALAVDLRDRVPYLHVRAHPQRVEELKDFDWSGFDLAILATGSVGVELALSRQFYTGGTPGAVLHTWLEPMGIGGHALLSLPREGRPGCLRCLYTEVDGGLRPSRSSFADPEAETEQDLSGCGSRFTPFGNLDALRTATLAVDLSLATLRSEEPAPCLRAWQGDDSTLQRAGVATTHWYGLGEVPRSAVSFAHRRCPVCGGVPS